MKENKKKFLDILQMILYSLLSIVLFAAIILWIMYSFWNNMVMPNIAAIADEFRDSETATLISESLNNGFDRLSQEVADTVEQNAAFQRLMCMASDQEPTEQIHTLEIIEKALNLAPDLDARSQGETWKEVLTLIMEEVPTAYRQDILLLMGITENHFSVVNLNDAENINSIPHLALQGRKFTVNLTPRENAQSSDLPHFPPVQEKIPTVSLWASKGVTIHESTSQYIDSCTLNDDVETGLVAIYTDYGFCILVLTTNPDYPTCIRGIGLNRIPGLYIK